MYFDEYACAVLSDDPSDKISGWVIACQNPEDWDEKLALFDDIEEYYPGNLEESDYLRIIVKARLLSPKDCVGSEPIGAEN